MSQRVPSIRAGVLAPILRWAADRGMAVEDMLRSAGLGDAVVEDTDSFAPILNSSDLLRRLGRTEGADVFCRIGATTDFSEVGAIGRIARARLTPRDALHAVAGFMPRHSTHERLAVEDTAHGVRVIDTWALALDAEAQHFVHQYVAALVQCLCATTAAPHPLISRVEIVPHPTLGLGHLARWFGEVEAAHRPRLVVDIPARVADMRARQFFDARDQPSSESFVRATHVDFLESLRWTILALLGGGSISIRDVASAADMTPRALQRRLAAAGVSFSDLLEETRRDLASRLLASDVLSVAEVAERLGYANPSALSRAVRRWTGAAPRDLRRQALIKHDPRRNGAMERGAKW